MKVNNDYVENKIYDLLNEFDIKIMADGHFEAESIKIIQLIVSIEEFFEIQFPVEFLDFDKLNLVEYYTNTINELVQRNDKKTEEQ